MVEIKPNKEEHHARLDSASSEEEDEPIEQNQDEKWVIGFNERFSDEEDEYIQLVLPGKGIDGPSFRSLKHMDPYTKKLLIKSTDAEVHDDEGLDVTATELTAYKNKTTANMTHGTSGGVNHGLSEQRELNAQSRETMVNAYVKHEHSESSRAKFKATVRNLTREYNQGRQNIKYRVIRVSYEFIRDFSRRLYQKLARIIYFIQPLYYILHHIEKKFGTGIASFFDLWIQIIYLNCAIFFVTLCLGVVPWFFSANNISSLAIRDFQGVVSLFLGLIGIDESYIGRTFFFYGGYADRDAELNRQWNTPVFYALCIVCYYGISLFIIVIAMGFRLSVVTSLDRNIKYSATILSMWDHRLISKTSINSLKRAVASRLRELIAEDEIKNNKGKKVKLKFIILKYTRMVTGWILSLALIASAPTAVYFITQYNDIINSVVPSVTSIVIVLMSTIYPKLLQACVLLEGYPSAFVTNINNVIRTFIVKMVIATSLILRVMFPNSSEPNSCVGTKAGMVFWQLLIIDFFSSAISNVVPNLAFMAFNSRVKKGEDPKLEFNVSDAINQVLYRQVIIWIGSALCPMLPLLGVVSSILLYLLKYVMSLISIKFPKNPMANAKGSIFNLSMLLLTLMLSLIPGIFFMLKKDNNCGPFRFDSHPYNTTSIPTTGFNVISNFFQNDSNLTAWAPYLEILDVITNPLVLYVAILILMIILFFTFQRLRMYRTQSMIEIERTRTERQDKIDLSLELQRNAELQLAKTKEINKLRSRPSKRRFNLSRSFSRRAVKEKTPSKKTPTTPVTPKAPLPSSPQQTPFDDISK
mmetsp:Transcript_8748/g.12950  ORF Transcript_8748/g.12950 Transcript_8748/m.12950 type:complete len:811 (+) Transcript_8748:37-2469(+)